jgi:hypothetical protein
LASLVRFERTIRNTTRNTAATPTMMLAGISQPRG